MASNLPTLYANLCGSLSPLGQQAFLWAADGPDTSRYKYPSESFAREVEQVHGSGSICEHALVLAQRMHGASDEIMENLQRFMIKRHANYRFGGNQKMWWE